VRSGEYPDDWEERRERVLERDNHECQKCGATEGTLQVHHIRPISERGTHKKTNLQTICRSCHADEHPVQVTLSSSLRANHRIKIKYRSSTGTRVREVDPYALETHEGIQYLVGHDYYRDEIRHFRPTCIEWVTETDQEFSPPTGFDAGEYLADQPDTRDADGCFIVTAAYGTRHAEEIDELRDFRYSVLRESLLGRAGIRLYYSVSPPVARWVRRKEWR
jgi:hypothetical protein